MTGGSRRRVRAQRAAVLTSVWRRRLRHGALACAGLGTVLAVSCYSTGNGTNPPLNTFYYPVGLAVSAAGNVLYAANSDFDLQWNGGTVQSYDLTAIRNDTVRLILGLYTGAAPFDAGFPLEAGVIPADAGPLPFEAGVAAATAFGCPNTTLYPAPANPNNPTSGYNGGPQRLPIGQACSPPMDSTVYFRDAVIIGAFATDAQLSKNQGRLVVPVRGDATLTWMDVQNDNDPRYINGPPPNATADTYPPFKFVCGQGTVAGCPLCCDSVHHAGQLTDPGNTRNLSMPGEPFAMAFSEDGTAIAVTNQAEADTSLFLSGFIPANPQPTNTGGDGGSATDDGGSTQALGTNEYPMSIQYYVDNLPLGGDGIAAVPHDLASVPNMDPTNPLRPAFLQTSNVTAEIDLLRYYTDEGYQGLLPADGGVLVDAGVAVIEGSSNLRPFMVKERQYGIPVEANGTNSRGIAIDPTPRIACEQAVLSAGGAMTSAQYVACAQTPSRVFIASRSPNSLIVGQIGAMSEEGGTYDPDALTLLHDYPLSAGPSNVYVAPIVDKTGKYSVRVFVVCFDSQTIAIFNPDTGRVENQVTTGPGPFAMAFDPFDITSVATHATVAFDPRSTYTIISKGNAIDGEPALRKYRFAYISSFTDSYVQVMDLDESFQDDRLMGESTFETMVYSLGLPVPPVQAN